MKPVHTMKELQKLADQANGDFSLIFVTERYTCYKQGRYCTIPDAWF